MEERFRSIFLKVDVYFFYKFIQISPLETMLLEFIHNSSASVSITHISLEAKHGYIFQTLNSLSFTGFSLLF